MSIVYNHCTNLAIKLALLTAAVCGAQDLRYRAPGQGLQEGLFRLKEMDFHLHAGMERPIELEKWIDLAVADGRRVMLLLDHLELYRKTPEQYQLWRTLGGFQARYPPGAEGHHALIADFDAIAKNRKDALIFKGWEVGESELDTGLEIDPLRLVDAIGWHISPHNGGAPPDGRTLLKRVRQIIEVQKQLRVPMILLHPFPMRIENLQKTASRTGRDVRSITAAEYRFFHGREQEELIRLLRGTSIYIEMNRDTELYIDDPACRRALIADIEPLARAGVQFTVASDNHHMRAANKPFDPDHYCRPVGVTEFNTNTIVRELLSLRARNRVAPAVSVGEH